MNSVFRVEAAAFEVAADAARPREGAVAVVVVVSFSPPSPIPVAAVDVVAAVKPPKGACKPSPRPVVVVVADFVVWSPGRDEVVLAVEVPVKV